MIVVPEINYLYELDPTHICKVTDEENVEWGTKNGWKHSFVDPQAAYEETFG